MKKLFFFLMSFAVVANAFAITPADPTNVSWYDSHAENGLSRLNYSLPTTDVDGNALPDLENLGFRVFTDNDLLFTFEASVYTNDLYSDMTEIYYWIYAGNGYDFNGNHTYFYRTNWEGFDPFFTWRIGIQAVYNDNGTKTYSNIVYDEVFPQANVPKPANPSVDYWEEAWGDSQQFMYTIYPMSVDYESLDEDNMSYTIYLDNDQVFVFTPEEFPSDFDEPTTVVPVNKSGMFNDGTTIMFENRAAINATENPFFTWRIGIQVHYTVDGVTNSSDIVYLEVFPQMHPATVITPTSFVADWTSEPNCYQHAGFVGYDLYVINKATQETIVIDSIPSLVATIPFPWVPGDLEVDIAGGSYLVEGLTPGATYEYYVVGRHHWGTPTVDIPSVIREVTLPGAPTVLRGDVNGNGEVDLDDLTALINYLVYGTAVNMPNSAACSSLDDTTEVNLDDLTALINYLVYNHWDN